jgi:hypothetical protein
MPKPIFPASATALPKSNTKPTKGRIRKAVATPIAVVDAMGETESDFLARIREAAKNVTLAFLVERLKTLEAEEKQLRLTLDCNRCDRCYFKDCELAKNLESQRFYNERLDHNMPSRFAYLKDTLTEHSPINQNWADFDQPGAKFGRA